MRRFVLFVLLASIGLVLAHPASAYPGAPWFEPGETYDGNFPDPSVLYDPGTGRYYAYATTTGGPYLPAMSSTDAVTWTARPAYPEPGCVAGADDPFYNDALPCPSPWAPDMRPGARLSKDLWAPGVARIGHHWVLFYAIRVSTSAERFCLAAATASDPLGPFTDVRNAPFHCDDRFPNGVLDPQPFVDPATGTPYLLWKSEGIPGSEPTRFWVRQLTADGTAFAPGTVAHDVLATTNGSWEGNVIESPTMVHYGDRWFLFYSANEWYTADYATGVAFCSSPIGPCHKSPANPVLRSGGEILGPGGPSVFVDHQGSLRLAHHYWRAPHVGYPSDPGCDGIDPETHQPHCESQGQRRMRITHLTVLPDRVTTATPPLPPARNIDSACPTTLAPRPYLDVPSGSNAARAVSCMTAWGVTGGSGNGNYNPSGAANREQMASFVARLIDETSTSLPPAGRDFFGDDNSSGHQDNINRLAAAGIVTGIAPGVYAPQATVTRAQMATFLFRAARFVLGQELPGGQEWFADDNGSNHQHAINAMAQAGVATGTGPGAFSPTKPVSRAQMANFLARLADVFVDAGKASPPAA